MTARRATLTLADLEDRTTIMVDDTPAFLGIGLTLARQMAREGTLPGVRRLGSRYVVVVPELLRFLGVEGQQGE